MAQAKANVAKKELMENISVSGGDLKSLKNCDKEYEIKKIGLSYPEYRALNIINKCFDLMKKGISSNTDSESTIPLIERLLDDELVEELFSCALERDVYYQRTLQQLNRFHTYLETKKVVKVDASYKRAVGPITYRGRNISELRGKFDLIYEEDGLLHGVIFKKGTPKESYSARKIDRKPSCCVEILTNYLASRADFPDVNVVELWYLSNKDDVGSEINPTFEHRRGKNIIAHDFNEEENEVIRRWTETLKGQEVHDCDNCRQKVICQYDRKPTIPVIEEMEKSSKEKRFTDSQMKVISHFKGAMAAVAVPGAGKTSALVERMYELIKTHNVSPSSILVVTFTNKAANELKERVTERLGSSKIPKICTYHSLGFSILKENPMYLGSRIRLAKPFDRYSMIFRALKECPKINGISYLNPFGEYGIVRFLDNKFEELQKMGLYKFSEKFEGRYDVEGIKKVYDRYLKIYKDNGYISFDDQIQLVNEMFDEYPKLVQAYSTKYEFVMVDEFQDSSEDQVEMIYSIAKRHGNIVVVGDDDQSIYAWRGGSSKYMLQFKRDFQNGEIVYMEDNFRCNAGVVNLLNELISTVGERYDKKLIAHSDTVRKPLYYKDFDPSFMAEIVKKYIENGSKPGDIAILARNNRRLAEIEEVLKGVCEVSVPKDYIIEDVVFQTIYDILHVYYNGAINCDTQFYHALKVLGAEDVRKSDKSVSLFEDLVQRELIPARLEADTSEYADTNTYKAADKLYVLFDLFDATHLGDALDKIVELCYGMTGHPVVKALKDIAEEKGIVSLEAFYGCICDMVTFKADDRVGYEINPNAVNLLTCHDAKGKEFPTVIIYGMEDFSESSEEEIRVLYVAMSRAQNNLDMMETSYNRYEGFDRIAPYVKVIGI